MTQATVLDETNSILLEVSCPGDVGIPLNLAGYLLTMIGTAYPNTTIADSPNRAPLCVRISKADIEAFSSGEDND